MNHYPSSITDLHIELTDKCQASCPMCARNYLGGKERPFVGKKEITLDQFKRWFSPVFLKKIKNFYACGNYGDPILAKDCLEIFQYVRKFTDGRLAIHTNGSARTKKWWSQLADAMAGHHDVVFGIDGYKESHKLYRRGTDWDKIIENAVSFIDAGGNARVDTLIFEHNENEIEDFKRDMLRLGFKEVNIKYTKRFYNMEKFPVYDNQGNYEYDLKPSSEKSSSIQFINLNEIKKNIDIWRSLVDNSEIKPRCIEKKEIYIDAGGFVYPCCWIGSDMLEEPIEATLDLHHLRNRFVLDTQNHFQKFKNFNLESYTLESIILNDHWNFLKDKKPWTCIKNCKK
jgi:MoaA/NifB/PqqE/SkfB family radical SAM enzyme